MLFMTEMWERFSFYGMRALLVLYLTSTLFYEMGTEAAKAKSYGIYAAYGALVYATPFIGGRIADLYLGFKKTVLLGAILMAIGHFVMAIETETFLYIALAFLIVGNGMFKPNISNMVGGLYRENDARRDGGFTIFYMGINLGAVISGLLCGWVGAKFGWSYGFGIAGVGMLIGLITFGLGQGKLGPNGDPPDRQKLEKNLLPGVSTENSIYILSFLSVVLFAWLMKNYELMGNILTPFCILVLLYIFVKALRSEKIVRDRLFVVLTLFVFTMIFFAFFEQAGSSINLFTNSNVNRTIAGFEVPTAWFQSVNPALILLLATPFDKLWKWLAKSRWPPSAPTKFVLGLAQLGLGFLVLAWSVRFVSVADISVTEGTDTVVKQAAVIPMIFLLVGYLLHTTGELCLSPIGLSLVTKLTPKEMGGTVMGAWFLSVAMAHHAGGVIAKLTAGSGETNLVAGEAAKMAGILSENQNYSPELLSSFDSLANFSSVFGPLGYVALAAAFLLLLLVPLLNRGMHGVK